jgi:ribosome-associated protein
LRTKAAVRPLLPKSLARRVAVLALEKKAEDISILELTGLSAACDYFVVCSAGSEPQVQAIADHIQAKLAERGQPPWHVEGRSHRRWVLLDFVHVVAHVFHRETREYYMLERLWGDAKVTHVREPKPKRRVEG